MLASDATTVRLEHQGEGKIKRSVADRAGHRSIVAAAAAIRTEGHAMQVFGSSRSVLSLADRRSTELDQDGPPEIGDGQDEDATELGRVYVSPEMRAW